MLSHFCVSVTDQCSQYQEELLSDYGLVDIHCNYAKQEKEDLANLCFCNIRATFQNVTKLKRWKTQNSMEKEEELAAEGHGSWGGNNGANHSKKPPFSREEKDLGLCCLKKWKDQLTVQLY